VGKIEDGPGDGCAVDLGDPFSVGCCRRRGVDRAVLLLGPDRGVGDERAEWLGLELVGGLSEM
jgi:hypothetical protein